MLQALHLSVLQLTTTVARLAAVATIICCQYFAGMVAKLPVTWPEEVAQAMTGLSDVWGKAFGSVASLDCLLQAFGDSSGPYVDRPSLKALINLLLPVLVFLLVLCCQMVWWAGRHRLNAAVATFLLKLLRRWPDSDGIAYVDHVTLPNQSSQQQQQSVPGTTSRRHAVSAAVSRYRSLIKRWSIRAQFLQASRAHGSGSHMSGLQRYMRQAWVVTLLVTVFFFYPSVARVAVSMFTCVSVCEERYWAMDMDLLCPTQLWNQAPSEWPVHAKWAAGVGIPSVVLVVTVPLFVALLLCWGAHRKRLHTFEFHSHFGFMYSDYKTDHVGRQQQAADGTGLHPGPVMRYLLALRQWVHHHLILVWDAVIHIQTVLLVCVSVIGMLLHEYYQTLILAAVFGTYLMLIAWLCPFRNPHVQRLQCLSSATLFVSCLLVLFLIPPDYMDTRQSNFYRGLQPDIGRLLIVINVTFVSFACIQMMRCLSRKVRWQLQASGSQGSKLKDTAVEGVVQQAQQPPLQ
jgi:hypothetical protein